MAKLKVAILYGVNEGPALGRQLRRTLTDAGFVITTDTATADIIFAHSGGCFLIPPKNTARLVVLVGLSYWPGKPLFVSTMQKIWRDGAEHRSRRASGQWLIKLLHNARYFFSLGQSIRMLRAMHPRNSWNGTQSYVIIRNRHDTYSSPRLLDIPFRTNHTFISLPGEHDDCWHHPTPYVRLIQSSLQLQNKE